MRSVRLLAAVPLAVTGALALSSVPGSAGAAAPPPVRITSLTLGRHVLPPTGGATALHFEVQHGALCWVTAPAAVTVSRVRRGCRNGKLSTVVRVAASDVLHPSHYRINAFVRGLDGRVLHRTVVLGEQGLTPLRVSVSAAAKPVVGQGYSARLVGTGGRAPYTWSLVGGSLPTGVTMSPTGALAGTPTAAGNFSADVRITDASVPTHLSVTVTVSILVSPPALGLSTPQLPQGTVGQAYSATLGATGGTTPYTWSVTSGSLPAGIALSPAGTLSGTPTTAGTSSAVVQVTDASAQHATETITMVVNPSPVAVTTSVLPSASVGAAYAQTLTATGGTTPYTWSVISGTLPTGLTLTSTGVLSGTPTTAGSSTVTVQVADATGQKATANLTLTVVASSLSITTATLPAVTSGTPYLATLTATGGTTPYTWTLTGSLPTGLAFDTSTGQIYGLSTDTSGSPYSITIQVTDSSAPTKQTATKQFTLTVS